MLKLALILSLVFSASLLGCKSPTVDPAVKDQASQKNGSNGIDDHVGSPPPPPPAPAPAPPPPAVQLFDFRVIVTNAADSSALAGSTVHITGNGVNQELVANQLGIARFLLAQGSYHVAGRANGFDDFE